MSRCLTNSSVWVVSSPPLPSSLPAAFDTSSVRGEVLLSSPTVVEWRFSPAPRPAVDGSPVSIAAESSRRRSWLRRRVSGLGGGGRRGDGDVDSHQRMSSSAAGGDRQDTRPVKGGVRKGGAAHYVASLLPVGPDRTRVFARCVNGWSFDDVFPVALFGRGRWLCLHRGVMHPGRLKPQEVVG